jgi:hypothetical protein
VVEGVRLINTDCVKVWEKKDNVRGQVCYQVMGQVEDQVHGPLFREMWWQVWFEVFK